MQDILTNTTVVHLDITIWTGKAVLKRTEVDDSNLPPEELATLGSKKLFDTTLLKPFNGIKSSAFSYCNKYGVRFLSGWLIDNSYLQELVGKLADLRVRWDGALQDFLANYQAECQNWLRQNAKWQNILANSMPRESEIAKRFNFGWQTFGVVPAPTNVIGDQTQEELGIVPSRAIEKLAREIKDTLPVYAPGKPFRTAPLRKLVDMCRTLSFTSPEVGKLEEVLSQLASTNSLDITQIMLDKLSDPKELAAICQPSKNACQIVDDVWTASRVQAVQPEDVSEPEQQPEPVKPAAPLPDIDSLLSGAMGILNQQPATVQVPERVIPMPEPVLAPVVPPAPVPEPMFASSVPSQEQPAPAYAETGSMQQAVADMMGMIDSGGLW